MAIKIDELNLEAGAHEKYQIFYHGDIKIKAGSPKYYVEIFLMPYNIHASYKDLIRRQISMEFARLLIVGAVFDRNNKFIEFTNAETFTLNIRATTLEYPYFLKNKPTDEFNRNLISSSIGFIPTFSRKVWGTGINYDIKNYTEFLFTCFEASRFFFFCDIKITNAILNGTFMSHIGKEARIVTTDNGKRIGFVSIKEGYSDIEKRVLAWLCLSTSAYAAASKIFASVHAKTDTNNNPLVFLRTSLPADQVTIKIKARQFAKTNNPSFFANEIIACDNFFPVDEVIYTPFVDHRSIKDKDIRAGLKEKSYKKTKYTNSSKNKKSDPSLSSEKPSGQESPGQPELEGLFSHFFENNSIEIKSSDKGDQDYRYKGTCVTITVNGSKFTTSKSKKIDATAAEIDSMNIKGHNQTNDFKEFLKSLLIFLPHEFNISELNDGVFSLFNLKAEIKANSHAFVVVEIEAPGNRYFYLIERLVEHRINKSLILLYDPLYAKIKESKVEVYLNELVKKAFSRENLKTEIKDDGLRIRLFYRCEDNVPISAEEMSERIKDFINSNQRRLGI